MADGSPSVWERLGRQLLTPWFVLGLLAAVIVMGVLITPVQEQGYGYPRLTTHAAADGGALALYRTAERLGWEVERLERPMRRGADSGAVYAVLDPPEPLTSSDVSALLRAVWRGGGLLAVLSRNSALGDSLGINVHRRPYDPARVGLAGPLAAARPDLADLAEPDDEESDRDRIMPTAMRVLEFARPQHEVTRLLTLSGIPDSSDAETRDPGPPPAAAVAASFAYGRGRVVVVSDARILRNIVLEETYGGIIAVRLLELATPPGIARLVFDEYHFGHGQRSTFAALVARALFGTRAGRLTLGLGAAALLLLAAAAPRALAPVPRATIERRSPLEHVGALARAYEQIDATQTAIRRLLRGLRRRRTPLGSALSDEGYLDGLANRYPALAADITIVRHALQRRGSPEDLSAAANALERIEHTAYPTSEPVTT